MSDYPRAYPTAATTAVNPVDDGTTPAPPRPGLRHSWRRRLITWPAAALMIIATVAVGRLIQLGTPIGDDYNRPFIHSGQMDEPVDGGEFVVTVDSVRGGRALQQISRTVTTDGIFLLVKVRLSAYDKEVAVSYLALRDHRGFLYDPPNVDYNNLEGHRLQPRIPIAGEVLFEVPTTAVTSGLTLRLSTFHFNSNAHQVVAEIPLTITEAQLSSWFRDAEPLKPMPPEVTT
jgi:hypothetical protein